MVTRTNMQLNKQSKSNWIVVLLITFTIVSIEISVSFNSVLLPNLKGYFAISEQLTQWTLSIALAALGISGLFYGALSDRFGRRPVLLTGFGLFCIGALGAALAPNIIWLLIARFIQGFGAGVGWIVGNACLKDLFSDKNYLKVMNLVHAMVGIVPAIAPAIGSYLGMLIGWRGCFWLIFIFSTTVLITKFNKLPETNFDRHPVTISYLKSVYLDLCKNREYIKYLLVKIPIVMLLFLEASNIPLIYVEYLNIPSAYYGLFTIPVSLIYVSASYISSRLSQKINVDKILMLGLICILVSNLLVLTFSCFTNLSAIEIQAIKSFTYLGWGLIFGNATGAIISSAAKSAGAASSVMISLEMLFASLGIYLHGWFFNGTIIPLSTFMILTALFCMFVLGRGFKRSFPVQ